MKRAFTLFELVIVLAIITIVAIMLMPAFEQGRIQAIRVKCMSRERQVGMAVQMYRGEHDGLFPSARRSVSPENPDAPDPTASLAELYPAYASKPYLFQCPATQDLVAFEPDGRDFKNCSHFFVSPRGKATRPEQEGLLPPMPPSYFYDGGWPGEHRLPRDAHPSRVIYGDECVHDYWENVAGKGFWVGQNNHEGGGNFLFVDGHVQWLPVEWTGAPFDAGRSWPYVRNTAVRIRLAEDHHYTVGCDSNVFTTDWPGKNYATDADLAGMMWIGDSWKEF